MKSIRRIVLLLAFLSASIPHGSEALPSGQTLRHPVGPQQKLMKADALQLRKTNAQVAETGLRLNGGKNTEKSRLRRIMCTAAVGFLSGSLAGLACDVVLWPIETIKTRLQTSTPLGISFSHPLESLKSLYDGCYVAFLFAPIFWGLFFAAYEPVRNEMIAYFGKSMSTFCYMVSAAFGMAFCFIVRVPVEIIKTRMMTGVEPDFLTGVRRVLKNDGFFGLYRGFWCLALREFPFTIIEMTLYENVRAFWAAKSGRKGDCHFAPWETSIIGSICDSFSGAITNPFDVVKSRLMKHQGKGYGMVKIMQGVMDDHGVSGFFRGAAARTLWMGMGGIIFWPPLEWAQENLSKIIN